MGHVTQYLIRHQPQMAPHTRPLCQVHTHARMRILVCKGATMPLRQPKLCLLPPLLPLQADPVPAAEQCGVGQLAVAQCGAGSGPHVSTHGGLLPASCWVVPELHNAAGGARIQMLGQEALSKLQGCRQWTSIWGGLAELHIILAAA
eukprot:scaffold10558_cov21-Tisochrysis_lutea.AAC.4